MFDDLLSLRYFFEGWWTLGVVLLVLGFTDYKLVKSTLFSVSDIISLLIIPLLLFWLIYTKILVIRRNYEEKLATIASERKKIKDFLAISLGLHSEVLKIRLQSFRHNAFLRESLKPYGSELNKKLDDVAKAIEINAHREQIMSLKNEESELRQSVSFLEEEKRTLSMNEKTKLERALSNLDTVANPIFIKNELSKEERSLLTKEGYKQVNQYCVQQNKIITVLARPVMNHSLSHVFLVWSVQKLLKNLPVENVQEHDTKDADITFKYKNKYHAIEVETGSLLRKKEQLTQKVEYLNSKFPGRWFFVVSNKNLQPKYRKYGPTTQRRHVAKTLRKLLKLPTQ